MEQNKYYYIALLLLTIMIIVSAFYYFALQPKDTNTDVFYLPGTYQFNHSSTYLTILRPSSDGKNTGDFEWYDETEHKLIFKGTYKIQTKGILSLYANEKSIGTLVVVDKQYYLIDDLSEQRNLQKISSVPTLFTP